VHGLEAKYAGKVRFVYLNIDDPATTSFKRELGYRVQPNLFLLDGTGQIVQQWLGRVTAQDLEPALQQISQ
jgi:hypothetical protein